MKQCPNCKKEYDDKINFCKECGTKLVGVIETKNDANKESETLKKEAKTEDASIVLNPAAEKKKTLDSKKKDEAKKTKKNKGPVVMIVIIVLVILGLFGSMMSDEFEELTANHPNLVPYNAISTVKDLIKISEKLEWDVDKIEYVDNNIFIYEENEYYIIYDNSTSIAEVRKSTADGEIVINLREGKEEHEAEQGSEKKELLDIMLVDGELGEYGKEVEVDGEKYIFYYIPAGKYKVTLKKGKSVTTNKGFIEKNTPVKNSEGYTEYPISTTLTPGGAFCQYVTIEEDEHVLLVMGITLEFEQVDE